MKRLVITRRGRRVEPLEDSEIAARKDAQAQVQNKAAAQGVLNQRRAAYGSAEEQLEFLAEHGIEAFRERQAAIKARHPKPDDEQPARKKTRKKKS